MPRACAPATASNPRFRSAARPSSIRSGFRIAGRRNNRHPRARRYGFRLEQQILHQVSPTAISSAGPVSVMSCAVASPIELLLAARRTNQKMGIATAPGDRSCSRRACARSRRSRWPTPRSKMRISIVFVSDTHVQIRHWSHRGNSACEQISCPRSCQLRPYASNDVVLDKDHKMGIARRHSDSRNLSFRRPA